MGIEFQTAYLNHECDKMKSIFLNGIKHIPLTINERFELINKLKPLFTTLSLVFNNELDLDEKKATLELFNSEVEKALKLRQVDALKFVKRIIAGMINNAPGSDNQAMRLEMIKMLNTACAKVTKTIATNESLKGKEKNTYQDFEDPRFLSQSTFYLSEIINAIRTKASHLKLRFLVARAFSLPDFIRSQQLDMAQIIDEELKNSAYTLTVQKMISQYILKHIKKTESSDPVLTQRLPSMLKKKDYFTSSSGREVTLIDRSYYKQFKEMQLMLQQSGLVDENAPHLASGFYRQSPQGMPLKNPVFIGQNGEFIVITNIKLGEGGFGKVFVGMDIDTGKFVAVKEQMASQNKNPIQNIRQEQLTMDELNRLVAKLEQGNLVYTVDSLGWGNEYTEAKTKVENDVPELPEQIAYKCDMALALFNQIQILHKRNYIHRDIKLDNALWDDKNKKVHLIDFGMTLVGSSVKTKEAGRGTPLYLSPETVKGEYSTSSDVYACGVALLELFLREDNIFDYKDDWVDFYRDNDTDSIYYLMCELANKIDIKHPSVERVRELIIHMVSSVPAKRPNLEDVIAEIQKIAININFELFKSTKLNSKKVVLSDAELQNPRIRASIFSRILKDDSFLEKISSSSLYVLLKQVTVSGNAKLFEKVALKISLFDNKNAAFHDIVRKIMLDKLNKNSSSVLIKSYFDMVMKLSEKDQKSIFNALLKKAGSYGENKEKIQKTIRGYYNNNAIISSKRNRVDSSVARQDLLTTSYKNKSRSNQLQTQSNVENVEKIKKPYKIEKPR